MKNFQRNIIWVTKAVVLLTSAMIYAQIECIDSSKLTVTGGQYESEVSWSIISCDGATTLESGVAPFESCVDLPATYKIVLQDSYGDGWDGAYLTLEEVSYTFLFGSDSTLNFGCPTIGCTDALACNFDESASIEDGSCYFQTEYADCDGVCANDLNYNGVCDEIEVEGCTNFYACNFNINANLDDGSCELLLEDELVNCNLTCDTGDLIHVGGGSSQEDIFWSIMDCSGELVVEGEVPFSTCVSLPEDYTINIYFTGSNLMDDDMQFDDNWNSDSLMDDNWYGDSLMDDIWYGDSLMDDNWYGDSLMDDNWYDDSNMNNNSNGGSNSEDSSNVHTLLINEQEYNITHGRDTAFFIGCSSIQVEGNDYLSNFKWIITDCEGDEISSSDTYFASSISLPENYTIFLFDTSENSSSVLKINNESYAIDEGLSSAHSVGCSSELVLGCIDEYACNYDSAAVVNDFTCEYAYDNPSFNCNISCETGKLIHVGGGAYQEEVSWSITDCYGDLVAEGGAPYSACLDLSDRFTLVLNDSYGDGWNQNFFYVNAQEYYTLESEFTDTVKTCVLGCVSENALNFDSLALDSSLCYFSGCTDPFALNFDPTANVLNDTLCTYSVKGCMYSWAFNFDSLANEDDGSCYEFIYGCIDTAATNYNNYNLETVSESLTGDTNIDVNSDDGSCLYNQGCTDSTMFNFCSTCIIPDDSCIPIVLGCIDATMFNYQTSANTSDNSCYPVINGCMDTTMFNYNDFDSDGASNEFQGDLSDVNTSVDSLCVPITIGCMETNAFNFNSTANVQLESTCIAVEEGCTNPIYLEYLGLAENVNTHNQDLCLNYLVIGCMDSDAHNFNAIANFPDDNTDYCLYDVISGCTDPSMFNYNSQATQDDGSCEAKVYGCIYDWAINYNTSANTDNNSCIEMYFGCTDSTAFNFNPLANVNQVSDEDTSSVCVVIVTGCSDDTKFNYNPLANVDDNSCENFIYGCQNSTALNYNPLANIYYSNDTMCYDIIEGCLDTLAFNFNNYLGALTGNVFVDVNTHIDSLCIAVLYGCTDTNSFNYNPSANVNQTSQEDSVSPCVALVEGCTDPIYLEFWDYNPVAQSVSYPASYPNSDDGSCSILLVDGCTNTSAFNFNALANINDNSCLEVVEGCTDALYLDYNPEANTQTNCNSLIVYGCTDEAANNFNANANTDDNSCYQIDLLELNAADFEYSMLVTARIINGDSYSQNSAHKVLMFNNGLLAGFASLDSLPNNQWYSFITVYSNSILDTLDVQLLLNADTLVYSASLAFEAYSMLGSIASPIIFSSEAQLNTVCTDQEADNYLEQGDCVVLGCNDITAINFNSHSSQNDGSCIYKGCTNMYYIQYIPLATIDDGSCTTTWQESYGEQAELIGNLQIQLAEFSSGNTVSQNEFDVLLSQYSSLQTTLDNSLSVNTVQADSIAYLNELLANSQTVDDFEYDEVNRFLTIPFGWSIFGYTCAESINVDQSFLNYENQILIVKDENGRVWLNEYNFNGIGLLQYGKGYQIKTNQLIEEFQFCPNIEKL